MYLITASVYIIHVRNVQNALKISGIAYKKYWDLKRSFITCRHLSRTTLSRSFVSCWASIRRSGPVTWRVWVQPWRHRTVLIMLKLSNRSTDIVNSWWFVYSPCTCVRADADNWAWPVDPHLRSALPEALLDQLRGSDRHLPHTGARQEPRHRLDAQRKSRLCRCLYYMYSVHVGTCTLEMCGYGETLAVSVSPHCLEQVQNCSCAVNNFCWTVLTMCSHKRFSNFTWYTRTPGSIYIFKMLFMHKLWLDKLV